MARQPLRVVASRIAAAALAATVLASGALAGCSADGELIVTTNAAGHVLMSDARHAEAVPGSVVEGTLTIVDSCFGLNTSTGDFAAVFPQGSGLIENTDQLSIPGWGTLGLGNHYQGGGGILESSTLSYHDVIPAGCQAGRIIVLNPIR